jgi:hypothetical protein
MGIPIGAFAGPNLLSVEQNTQGGISVPPSFELGTTSPLSDGGHCIYVKALSELSQFAACAVYANGTAQMLTTTIAATCKRVAWAQASVPSGWFAWLQSGGNFKGNLAANCDDNVPLYTTATAGVLDDATVSGGLIGGVINTVTISNATAVTLLGAFAPFIVTGATPA